MVPSTNIPVDFPSPPPCTIEQIEEGNIPNQIQEIDKLHETTKLTESEDWHHWALRVYQHFGLEEFTRDEHGLYDGLSSPPAQHRILWFCSFLVVITATYALIRGMHDLAIVAYSIAITSLSYWWRPVYHGWRRKADMMVVIAGLGYHMYRARDSEFIWIYYSIIAFGCAAYLFALYAIPRSSWIAMSSHIIVHLCANLSCWVLYSSNHVPRRIIFKI